MPFFPRFHTPMSAFPSDVFRLLDELNQASSLTPGSSHGDKRAFSPSFDIHETDSAFILEGELPGLEDKSKLNIEFTDNNTLLIRGRIEKSFQKTLPSPEESKPEGSTTAPATEDKSAETQVAHRADDTQKAVTKSADGCRCWVSERTVGEFQRSFSFPGVVDIEGVKAGLEHGLLKVVVPKKEAVKGKKIEIF